MKSFKEFIEQKQQSAKPLHKRKSFRNLAAAGTLAALTTTAQLNKDRESPEPRSNISMIVRPDRTGTIIITRDPNQ